MFTTGKYTLLPVRDEDKYQIMNWRNAQLDILRQKEPLAKDEQERYFKNVIDKLFDEVHPDQLIFSFLEDGALIGYGGLVHINWAEKTGEISFLTETSRNKDGEVFISDWTNYLSLLKQVADIHLNFRRIYTYAYDLRPNLYVALEKAGFAETERMKGYIKINGEFKDVVIHSLDIKELKIERALKNDVDTYYKWANDPYVRQFSYQQDKIIYENHVKWFSTKVNDPAFRFFIFKNSNNEPVGQVRINTAGDETIIGISIDTEHRGMGYGSKMLVMACDQYLSENDAAQITAYIKTENKASLAIFTKAGFEEREILHVHEALSKKLILTR